MFVTAVVFQAKIGPYLSSTSGEDHDLAAYLMVSSVRCVKFDRSVFKKKID